MDKILITAFKSEIATAILNSQEKLNPNKDAYIDNSEIPAILNFFGVDDVNKLLKTSGDASSQFVFAEEEKKEEEQEVNKDEFKNLVDSNNSVLNNDGSAAYELHNKVASDLALTSTAGTPFSAQMNNLMELRKNLIKKHQDTSDVDAKIDALNEAVQEYIKTNKADLTQALLDNDAVRTFKYGENGDKTGYFIQTFDFKGGNSVSNGSDDSAEGENESEEDGDKSNSNAGVNVKYGIEVLTDKLHAVANVEAGNDNSDLQGAVVYSNPLKNGGNLSFSGNFRQTIEKNNNQTAFGASLDYTKNKFSTGAYASYEASEVESEVSKNLDAEAYVKYGNSLRLGIGHESNFEADIHSNYNFVKAKVAGKRELNNGNLSLTGSVEGSYGVVNIQGESNPNYSVLGKGGLTFKSNNIKTNLYTSVGYDVAKNVVDGMDARTLSTTFVGNVSTNKIDLTATLSGVNSTEFTYTMDEANPENMQISSSRNWNLSSSITFTPKTLFGKNSKFVPSVTYTVTNGDDLKHYVGMNLGVNF